MAIRWRQAWGSRGLAPLRPWASFQGARPTVSAETLTDHAARNLEPSASLAASPNKLKRLLWALPFLLISQITHAEGYLSHYHGGSSRYLSDYPAGSYYSGGHGSSWHYGGPNTPIERKHGADWYRYQRALHTPPPQPLIVLHAYNTSAMRDYIHYWGEAPQGFGFTRASYAGTSLNTQTTRYNPRIHGDL